MNGLLVDCRLESIFGVFRSSHFSSNAMRDGSLEPVMEYDLQLRIGTFCTNLRKKLILQHFHRVN